MPNTLSDSGNRNAVSGNDDQKYLSLPCPKEEEALPTDFFPSGDVILSSPPGSSTDYQLMRANCSPFSSFKGECSKGNYGCLCGNCYTFDHLSHFELLDGFYSPSFNNLLHHVLHILHPDASADTTTVETKGIGHGFWRSDAISSGKCQHGAKEVALNFPIQGRRTVSLYLWHVSSSALYCRQLFQNTYSQVSNYGDTPLRCLAVLNVKFYQSANICSSHENYHPECIIRGLCSCHQNLKTLKRLNDGCDAKVCRPPKKKSFVCENEAFDSATAAPPPHNQSISHLEKHRSHVCEMLNANARTYILKGVKEEQEEKGCPYQLEGNMHSDNPMVGCKLKEAHIKWRQRKQEHAKDVHVDIKEDDHSTRPRRLRSMGSSYNFQEMQRLPHLAGKNEGIPSFANASQQSPKLNEEILRKNSTEGFNAVAQRETLCVDEDFVVLKGHDRASECGKEHSLDTVFSTSKQEEPSDVVEGDHVTSLMNITEQGSSAVTKKMQLPVHHINCQNLAQRLVDEDYQAYMDAIRKHGKLSKVLVDEDYKAYLDTIRKHGTYKQSKDSNYNRAACLMVDEDYEAFLKSICVQGHSYVLASKRGTHSSVIETSKDADLRDKDYNLFPESATADGHFFDSALTDFEQKPVTNHTNKCLPLKNSKRSHNPVKTNAVKRSPFHVSSKRILTSNKTQTCFPLNVRRSTRFAQLAEKQVDNFDLPPIHAFPRKAHECTSSGSVDVTPIYTSACYDSTEPNSFLMGLQTLLRKPYDKNEYKQLMKEATCRKPIIRERNLRGNSKTYRSATMGFSYLDYYPDFCRKIKLAPRGERLNLLRGFFFWLQNSCSLHSFKPWVSFPPKNEI